MDWKSAIVIACCAAGFCATPAAAAEQGVDFLVGTWTRDGDCKDGDIGTVQREGDIIKTSFASDDGNLRRYTYHIENDNRLRVLDFALCDRVHCEAMHVQTFFFVMRCAE
jgi:diadenosine tetraphosphatase ApaH/serine/threonine PP2A family protein phosphatase